MLRMLRRGRLRPVLVHDTPRQVAQQRPAQICQPLLLTEFRKCVWSFWQESASSRCIVLQAPQRRLFLSFGRRSSVAKVCVVGYRALRHLTCSFTSSRGFQTDQYAVWNWTPHVFDEFCDADVSCNNIVHLSRRGRDCGLTQTHVPKACHLVEKSTEVRQTRICS